MSDESYPMFKLGDVDYIILPQKDLVQIAKELTPKLEEETRARKKLGRALRKARTDAGLSQPALGRLVDRSQATISQCENGLRPAEFLRVVLRDVKRVLKRCKKAEPQGWVLRKDALELLRNEALRNRKKGAK